MPIRAFCPTSAKSASKNGPAASPARAVTVFSRCGVASAISNCLVSRGWRIRATGTSKRVPPAEDMVNLLELATQRLAPEQIWVNPDCGLKTRKWEEVRPALINMVAAARQLRAGLARAAE